MIPCLVLVTERSGCHRMTRKLHSLLPRVSSTQWLLHQTRHLDIKQRVDQISQLPFLWAEIIALGCAETESDECQHGLQQEGQASL